MRSDRSSAGWPLKIAAAGGLLFLHLPILLIFVYAFTTEEKSFQWPPPGFTTQWFAQMLENASLRNALFNSLTIAVCSAIFATCLGTFAARASTRFEFRGKGAKHRLTGILRTDEEN